jgi:beta-glucosidase
LSGEWLAQKQDLGAMGRVMANAVRVHAAMYHAVKRVQPGAQIGLALHWRTFDPLNPRSLPDRFAAALRTRILDEFILTAVQEGRFELPFALNTNVPEAQGTLDFLGLNYYFQEYTAFDPSHTREGLSRSVFDPDVAGLVPYFATVGNVRPDALRRTLVRLGQYHMPLYITENGFFETDCDDQSPYLVSHLQATLDAIQQGADVRGYFWWTLVDNFEWSEGYTPRFGLYRCDRATQARTPKPVAEVYARIIRANGIPDELSETYGRPK